MLLPSIAVLVAANVLNNKVAPRLAPVTSAAATLALVAVARRSGASWRELGFEHARRGAVTGAVLASGVVAVYTAGVASPRTRPLFRDDRALSLSRAGVLEAALVQVPFGTVLLEEVGFRGALYGGLRRTHGTATATAVSSALFGLWHILPAIEMARANPRLGALTAGEAPGRLDTARVVAGSVVSTGVVGAFFCELRRRTGLLGPSMLHLSTNSLGYLFARLAARRGPGIRRTQRAGRA
ncbi:CPBP family intramembrane glutamic endopeptidase [Nonomuraea lactucae]|uniref:CPBP family intramembrane glutamic endopeptidase n=1 Tax=Nonomuraea lactucae TaxID=2249762 RepID=UPI000DE2075A|nr:CPBP family intramembrane glutamic endopeptidase [Nonomuraea lactucae]